MVASTHSRARAAAPKRPAPATPPEGGSRRTRTLWQALLSTPLYRHTLIGRTPQDLRLRLSERWSGDTARGNAILAGDIEFAGEKVRNPRPVWHPPGVGEDWLSTWHGFDWL